VIVVDEDRDKDGSMIGTREREPNHGVVAIVAPLLSHTPVCGREPEMVANREDTEGAFISD
jgi:hypothetical protein